MSPKLVHQMSTKNCVGSLHFCITLALVKFLSKIVKFKQAEKEKGKCYFGKTLEPWYDTCKNCYATFTS